MSTPSQESTPEPAVDAPRFSRRTLLIGAGGLAGAGLVGGGGWYVWHGRQPVHTLDGGGQRVERVAFSPDGTLLADASFRGAVRLWRVGDGHLLRTMWKDDATFRGLAFSPDGQRIMAGGAQGPEAVICQWRVGDGAPIGEITQANDTSSPNGRDFFSAQDVAYSPDGALIACGTYNGYLYLWRASDGQFVRKMQGPNVDKYYSEAARVAFSPEGETVAIGTIDRIGLYSQPVLLWRVGDGTLMTKLDVFGTAVTGLSFSPDGQSLLTSAESPNLGGRVVTHLWRVRDREYIRRWDGFGGASVFAPDGQTFAVAQGRQVQVRRLDGSVVHTVTAAADSVSSIAFSPDGRLLATASNSANNRGNAQIWRLS